MRVEETGLPGVKLLIPTRFADARGWFCETWNRRRFAELGIEADFVQDNLSLSLARGTIRGLHYQTAPAVQGKLVQVLRGAVIDVAVDIRRGSATFGRHVAVPLDDAGGRMLYIPGGFAHGFCTLEEHVLFAYRVTAAYAPACERAILWSDPDIGVPWPVSGGGAILSPKDAGAPRLRDADDLL